VWLYVAPTGGNVAVLCSTIFWLGLGYVIFPINVMVYGINDYTDISIDKNNDRKGNFFFGAKCSAEQLKKLPVVIPWMTLVPLFFCIIPIKVGFDAQAWLVALPSYLLWTASAVGVNLVYNVEPFRLSSHGPYEIPTVVFGQSLVTILSCMVNNLALPPLRYWVHLTFLILRTQLWTEYMDYDSDLACRRRTTVCLFKRKYPPKWEFLKGSTVSFSTKIMACLQNAASIVFFSMLAEAVAVIYFFSDFGLQFFSCFGVVMFILIECFGVMESLESQKLVMMVQTFGGLMLIGHIWVNKLFVAA
jgi:hypothetical protein